ncbi:MAG: hypothetical protein NC396_01835 [Bacteroides sp.]|nr:hypothetical protein [Bacteroides sp.]MCM1084931.1 hypothetical protein [Bacteroides sp.]
MRAWVKGTGFVLGLLLPFWLSASDYTVRIIGTAKGAEGREVVWRADADPFSLRFVELDRCRIDGEGNFVLQTDRVRDVLPTYLVIDFYSTGFFARAGMEYRLQMAPFDYHIDERCNAFVPSGQLPALRYGLLDTAGNPQQEDLNALIGAYSHLYNRMVAENYERIGVQGDSRPVTDFIRVSDSLYGGVEDAFFAAYRAYTEADLKAFAGLASRRELYSDYLEDKTLDLDNPACIAFLKSYYADYFTTNRFLPFAQVARILNREDFSDGQRLACLADSMGLDYSLKGERLREWVLINACAEIWGDGRIDQAHLRSMLVHLKENTKFPRHAEALKNLLEAKAEAEARHYFTGVELTDSAGNKVKVEDLLEQDKFHYFVFVRAPYERCPSCGEEADYLRRLWNEADRQVRRAVKIVFVNCDYPYATYYHDAMRRHYPWPYLHFNGHIDWIRNIDAARFPAFVLVDDKGNVLNAGFNAPSDNLKAQFEQMGKLRLRKEKLKSGPKE